MSRPLLANPKGKSEAAEFHRRVFKRWGNKCYFCEGPATDACHIVSRAKLGPKRYACPEENGRPGCRLHHELQESGILGFDKPDIRAAVSALNAVLKTKLEMPT
jgi:predicted restriction endonuclease